MALARDAYEALEDIVGLENISEEPAVLDAYAKEHRAALYTGSQFSTRYEAILLPGSAEEVQAIVKICNKYGIQFKARGSGFGWFNAVTAPGVINLDMVRMDEIEIDEKNLYAVVGAGVSVTALNSELIKHGLQGNITGAGCTTAAMPLAAECGQGATGATTSWNNRNILGVEWVTPEGNIVRLGSLGSGDGWFTGDGPGPSLRGVIRGVSDAMGGLGVFTRAATKVYHYPGPRVPEIEGIPPYYTVKWPETVKAHYIYWDSWDKFIDAHYEIGKSEIEMWLNRQSPNIIGMHYSVTNEEYQEIFERFREGGEKEAGCVCVLMAESQKELDYKEKVLRQILSDTGGKILPWVEEPGFMSKLLWIIFRQVGKEGVMRWNGGQDYHATALGGMGTMPPQVRLMLTAHEIKERYLKEGLGMDDGLFADIIMHEHGHYAHVEDRMVLDASPRGRKAQLEYGTTAAKAMIEQHIATRLGMCGDRAHNEFGPLMNNYHLWQRKIKAAFDPNAASESTFYITQEGTGILDTLKGGLPDE